MLQPDASGVWKIVGYDLAVERSDDNGANPTTSTAKRPVP